jgi:hypothetical protein
MTFNLTENDWFFAGFGFSTKFKTPLSKELIDSGTVVTMYAVHIEVIENDAITTPLEFELCGEEADNLNYCINSNNIQNKNIKGSVADI